MSRFRTPRHREVSNDASSAGNGWTLDFFETNTTTRKDTFSDSALTTANANPVVADSAGRFGDIHLESGTYRVILKDADGVTIWDADPVEGASGTAGTVDDVDSNTTLSLSDNTQTKAVDASSTGITITLLDVATAGDGFEVTVKKVDSSTNTVTIDGNGAETIDGAANYVLSEQYESVTLRCDGDEWHVRNDHRWSPITTQGDIIRGDGNGLPERLGVGSNREYLRSGGTTVSWSAIQSGDLPTATTSAQGAVEKATQSEIENGTADKFPDASDLAAALGFSKFFESSEQSVSFNNTLDVAHGLGSVPKFFQVVLRNNSGEHGYSSGDEILVANYVDNAVNQGVTVYANSTNVSIATDSGIRVIDAGDNNNDSITAANWRWVVRAWA